MTRGQLLGGAAFGLALFLAYIALALWADERNQRFYRAREEYPDWARG